MSYNLKTMSNETFKHSEKLFLDTLRATNKELVPYNTSSSEVQCEFVLSRKFQNYYGKKINGKVLRYAAKSLVGSIAERVEQGEEMISYPFIFSLVNGYDKPAEVKARVKDRIMTEFELKTDYDYYLHMKAKGYHDNRSTDKEIADITNEVDTIIKDLLCL